MKQILQNLKTGKMELAELPRPQVGRKEVLIKTSASVISVGTERMIIDFSKSNLVRKARQQPEKIQQVIEKIKSDGLIPTLEAVYRKLDQPLPLGYCNAGTIIDVGPDVDEFQPGDRVVSNGPHAEIVCIPCNLCAKIPQNVTDEHAAFTVLGSIALQGIRLAAPSFGETFMVFGMGLIGLLTGQLLKCNGCEVIGVDINDQRLKLAKNYGIKTVNLAKGGNPIPFGKALTNDRGVDGVIITASAKKDNIIHQAAQTCRKRGRIVLVGVVDLNLRRRDFYEKELSFQVSCSYGPGRYDEQYEQKGNDYPYAYVRWTEQRNFEAVLEAIASGRLKVKNLITHQYPLSLAVKAYDRIDKDKTALGVILKYSKQPVSLETVKLGPSHVSSGKAIVGVIGAGNFAFTTILPCLAGTQARLKYIAGRRNSAAVAHAAKKFNIENATTNYRHILSDEDVDTVFIVTQHDSHAPLAVEALQAGKNVFLEKPLAIDENQLITLTDAVEQNKNSHLMAGFNRRFSRHIEKIKQLIAAHNPPLCMSMTINAGYIEAEHWVQDPKRGGGRIIGEVCHFIDLLSYICDSFVTGISTMMVGAGKIRNDKICIVLSFANGSVGTINYFTNGSKSYPKEVLEIFSDGHVILMDNFRVTKGYGFKGFKKFRTFRQDKGYKKEIELFINRVIYGGQPLISFHQMSNVTNAAFAAVYSARNGEMIKLNALHRSLPFHQVQSKLCMTKELCFNTL